MLKASLRGVTRLQHPLWMCGLRPFFLFAALAAPLLMFFWSLFLATGLPLPAVPGGPFVWHAHELLFGFAVAAMAGFLLTVVPEFAGGSDFPAQPVRRLAVFWLIGRAAFWLSGVFGTAMLAVAAFAHLALLGGLVRLVTPRLWGDAGRRHRAFFWALAGLVACTAGFYADVLRGEHPVRWLHATLGVFMMLMIVALSRISMRIVNAAIDDAGIEGVEYRARPPRRHLAIFCIALYTATEFFMPGTRLGGWFALAAAAALFNLMNDWHIGRVLFRRLPLMLYGVYVFMAAGYATMGAALVLETGAFSAGRHLLTVGALGLAIYAVMGIAGRAHCGRPFETRPWFVLGAGLIAAAACVRAFSAWPGVDATGFLVAAGLLWTTGFGLFAMYMVPLFVSPRPDGLHGCKGTAIP